MPVRVRLYGNGVFRLLVSVAPKQTIEGDRIVPIRGSRAVTAGWPNTSRRSLVVIQQATEP